MAMTQADLDAAVINRLTIKVANLTLETTTKDAQIEYLQQALGESQQQQVEPEPEQKPKAKPRKPAASKDGEHEVVEG